MVSTIIILSGRIASGKSTLADALADKNGFSQVRTSALIKRYFQREGLRREELQAGGDELDIRTNGRWVAEALDEYIKEERTSDVVVIDSVRIALQINAIRDAFSKHVLHVHLTATEPTLRDRFESRKRPGDRSWNTASSDTTERGVEDLADLADLVLDTILLSASGVLSQVEKRLYEMEQVGQLP